MPLASFDGLRVLSLESRRAHEVEKLIRTYNGEPFVVPSMREVPLESNSAALDVGRRLMRGDFDVVIFLTGVGIRAFIKVLETEHSQTDIVAALRKLKVISRGVKPRAVLNELQIPIAAMAPEPATWREVIATVDSTFGAETASMRVAVQEYGASNPELLVELVARFKSVTKVPVYQYALPHDLAPLRETVLALLHGGVDVALFMTAVQVIHLFQVATEMGLAEELRLALRNVVVVSIGPTTTEELQGYTVQPDLEPSRPKMGFMINEAAQYGRELLTAKRAAALLQQPGPDRLQPSRGVLHVPPATPATAGFDDDLASLNILHDISSRIASADPLHLVLERIVTFVCAVVPCDSCFVWTLEGDKLRMRASKNPHADAVDRLELPFGEGVTGWVAQHREPVALSEGASKDARFSSFAQLPEDAFEAMLCTPVLCANRVVGVINVRHRETYVHTDAKQGLLGTLGILVGAEIERARLETENLELTHRLESRKVIDRAKGILQRDLNLSEEEAYLTMQRESRQRRRPMRDIADDILLSDGLRPPLANVNTVRSA